VFFPVDWSPVLTVIVGVVSALFYGSADFLGGLSSRRIAPMRATAIAAVSGLAVLLIVLPFVGGTWSPSAVLFGALSGISGALALTLLYACLAIGPMSILSPLTAVVSAVVPLSVGIARGERLAPTAYLALGIALVAVVLVGFVPEKGAVRPSLKGIVMAIGSGAMIGVFLILIDLTPRDSGLVPLVVNRAVNSVIMFSAIGILALIAMRRARRNPDAPRDNRGWRAGLLFAIGCGVLDATANTGLLLGLRLGELSVMSVLTALYPAGTIILAAVIIKERIAPVQYVGLGLAIAAAAMLALA
jgi:drug/metabolite transporter (DMT)-like permease